MIYFSSVDDLCHSRRPPRLWIDFVRNLLAQIISLLGVNTALDLSRDPHMWQMKKQITHKQHTHNHKVNKKPESYKTSV